MACVDGTAGAYLSDESIEAVRVYSLDGQPLTRGRQVRIVVDVWAWSGFTSDKLDLFVASDANAPAWQLVTTLTPTRAGLNTLSATAVLPSGFSSAQAIRAQFRYGGSATPCVAGSYNDRDDLVFMPY